jgi:hypothetical protein
MAIPGHEKSYLIKACGRLVPRILDSLDVADVSNDSNWDDLRVNILSVRVPAAAGPDFVQFKDDGAASTGVFTYAFDPASEEQVYFSTQLPHQWKEESTIYPHIHWTPAVSGTAGQKVSWGLEYTMANVLGTFGNTTIVSSNAHIGTDTTLAAGKMYITPLGPGIDMTGQVLSTVLICRLFRDATGALNTDDLAQDALGLSVDFHYEIDAFGSSEVFTK